MHAVQLNIEASGKGYRGGNTRDGALTIIVEIVAERKKTIKTN
jgi:hypothetical protein